MVKHLLLGLRRLSQAGHFLAPITAIAWLASACSSSDAAEPLGSLDSASNDAGQGADSAAIDSPVEAPPQESSAQESCNFLDDDNDGELDEGFAWKAGTWKHLLSTKRFAILGKPVVLDRDEIALAGWDQYGDPGDRAFVGIWKTDGTLVAGPVWVNVPDFGAQDVPTLSRLGEDKLLLLFGSTDWDGCKQGCAMLATELSRDGLTIIKSSSWNLPSHRGDEVLRVSCVSAAQCLVHAQAGGVAPAAHLLSIDPATGTVGWTYPLPGPGAFDVDDGKIYVRAETPDPDGGTAAIVVHVLGFDGHPVQAPRIIGALGNRFLGITHQNGSTYTEIGGTDPGSTTLVRIPDDGSPVVAASDAFVDGTIAVEDHGDTIVVASLESTFGLRISRVGPDLLPKQVPQQSFTIQGGYAGGAALVRSGNRFVVFQANYDGRSVDMINLECAP